MTLERSQDLTSPDQPAPVGVVAGFPFDEFVALLRCPCCHGPGELVVDDDVLVCPGCSHRFAFRRGVPVLLCEDRDVEVMPDDHQSNAINDLTFEWLNGLSGYSLNLGAGATQRRPRGCVEVEYSVFRNTTAVADAHNLPFRDAVFDAVVSFNTFEHLSDPPVAARELYRVLKPGGRLQLQTAFLQPLHEGPAHFYDATEFGVRRWFADFDVERCFVPDNMSPEYALAWMASTILRHVAWELGPLDADRVGSVPLADWERFWGSGHHRGWAPAATLRRLSQAAQGEVAFGFELRGVRPADVRTTDDRTTAVDAAPAPAPLVPSRTSGVGLDELVVLLRCPCCHGPDELALEGDLLVCPACSHRFGFERGVPLLLCEDRKVDVMPDDHQSNQIDDPTFEWLDSLGGYSLNLGAGATERQPRGCVEVEYSVFRHTTAVGDAHNLPFRDAVFDAVVSFSTFEHLVDPPVAARELYRVLKPGGRLQIQTAFLQPLHEGPAHFFNATEFGVRRWFADFEVEECFVPDTMSPAYALAWLANHILFHVEAECGKKLQEMVGKITLRQWARFWDDPHGRHGFMSAVFAMLPDSVRSHFSAGFEILASRPDPAGS